MKRTIIACMAFACLSATPAGAISSLDTASDRTRNVDLSALYGGEPFNTGMGVTTGYGAGITYMSTSTTGLRADINYLSWSKNSGGTNLNYNRFPLFMGFRFFQNFQLPVYYELGVEAISDSVDSIGSAGKINTGYTRYGVGGGIGVEVPVGELYYVGGNFRYNVVSDPYFNVIVSIGRKF